MKVNSTISSDKPLYSSNVALLGSFSPLHQIKKGKGKEEYDGFRETSWHNMSVIVISLSQHINHCDMASLSGEIGRAPAPTWFVHPVSGLLGPILILRLRVFLS